VGKGSLAAVACKLISSSQQKTERVISSLPSPVIPQSGRLSSILEYFTQAFPESPLACTQSFPASTIGIHALDVLVSPGLYPPYGWALDPRGQMAE